jgi:hypothetical protein
VRPSAALSKTNILRVLQNAYVTKGKSIKKRPCLSFVATLEAGTVGLKSFSGKLNTFYGAAAAIVHADTRFVARRVPHITTGAAPTKIHYADQYSALLYVCAEYGDGTFRHHYLDDPGAWSAPARCSSMHSAGPPWRTAFAMRRPPSWIRACGRRRTPTSSATSGARLSERLSLRGHRDRRRRPLRRSRAGVAVDARPHGDRQPGRRSGDVDLPSARRGSSRCGPSS